MPNLAAILLVRVDLRVDRQQFRNHIKIPRFYELLVMSASPKSPGRHGGRLSQEHRSESRSGTGRHGGHPSQDPQSLKAMAKKTQRLCASARHHSALKATAHKELP